MISVRGRAHTCGTATIGTRRHRIADAVYTEEYSNPTRPAPDEIES
jgi:hypothetical protein